MKKFTYSRRKRLITLMKKKSNKPTFTYEEKLWNLGAKLVAGVDEVGRGPLAGPIVAAAVIFDPKTLSTFNDIGLGNVDDSKRLKPRQRESLSKLIIKHSLYYSISEISVSRINKHGIGKCSQYAFRKAVRGLKVIPDHILIDAFYIKYFPRKNQTPIIKGDQKCFSIAAASIIAKVYRDNLMQKLHLKFPKYGFDLHKGYGTSLHIKRIETYGTCKAHRTNFNIKRLNKALMLALNKKETKDI